MRQNAYAKVNLILNVLGTLPSGYHEVRMLMQAISLCDVVEAELSEHILGPQDFAYVSRDLAYKAALLMAESFRPELICSALDEDGLEKAPGVRGVSVSIEKRIPAAAGLAGGSADAAAVMICLARLWGIQGRPEGAESAPGPEGAESAPGKQAPDDALIAGLCPLGAKLGSDVPFCIASQLGRPAAIASGTGTELEFVQPTDCAVTLYPSDLTLPDKTRAVYRELKEEDCSPVYDIEAFLSAKTLAEKRSLMGNHLQPAAERILERLGIKPDPYFTPESAPSVKPPADAMLCGAGPTYFSIGEEGPYRTIL